MTGLCEEGCAAGWKGLNCDSGKVDDMMTWFSLLNNLFFQYFNESIHHLHVCFKFQIENVNQGVNNIIVKVFLLKDYMILSENIYSAYFVHQNSSTDIFV